jgi:hypothetical protein
MTIACGYGPSRIVAVEGRCARALLNAIVRRFTLEITHWLAAQSWTLIYVLTILPRHIPNALWLWQLSFGKWRA